MSGGRDRNDTDPIRVVNKYREPYDVYIGRGSIWGNPFVIGPDGDRDQVIRKYEKHLAGSPHLIVRLPELRGKTLGCFCAPQACHGDVLKRWAEQEPPAREYVETVPLDMIFRMVDEGLGE
jgi:hypothetical protein